MWTQRVYSMIVLVEVHIYICRAFSFAWYVTNWTWELWRIWKRYRVLVRRRKSFYLFSVRVNVVERFYCLSMCGWYRMRVQYKTTNLTNMRLLLFNWLLHVPNIRFYTFWKGINHKNSKYYWCSFLAAFLSKYNLQSTYSVVTIHPFVNRAHW